MDGNNNGSMPDLNVLKGALAVIFGIVLIVVSFEVILKVLCLIAGIALIYVGLVLLNMRQAIGFVDVIMERIKRLLSN